MICWLEESKEEEETQPLAISKKMFFLQKHFVTALHK